MFEQEDEPFEMRGFELRVDAVERMRDGVNDLLGLQVALKIKNVVAQPRDLMVLRLGDSPG